MRAYGAQLATVASSEVTLTFPKSVTARQRAVLHAVATTHGVSHQTSGDGVDRVIVLGVGSEIVRLTDDEVMNDDAICSHLASHLKISPDVAKRAFNAPVPKPEKDKGTFGGNTEGKTSSLGASPVSVNSANIDVNSFVHITLLSLELERTAEAEQTESILKGMSPATAQKKGRALLGLKCVDTRSGFYGKTIVTLEGASRPNGDNTAPPLLPHKLMPHDVVCLRPNKGESGGDPLASGVVYRVRDTQLEIAVDETPDCLDGTLRLERLQNETSHNRLVDALKLVGKVGDNANSVDVSKFPGSRLVEYLFGNSKPRVSRVSSSSVGQSTDATTATTMTPSNTPNPPPFKAINKGLDNSQTEAVAHALASQDIALVHGPPGTGKTTAVVEYVLQELNRGSRVLCCAASNVAVDTLVERIASSFESYSSGNRSKGMGSRKYKSSKPSPISESNLIRLGHPARLLPSVLQHSLEAVVSRSDDSKLAKDCEKECVAIRKRLTKLTGRNDRAERNESRKELRRLQKETKQRQKKAVSVVVKNSKVICCTLSGALSGAIYGETFDVVVIDEAAQALEPSCWGAMFKGTKTVLAGDHKQLPPTVLSDAASKNGLGDTLFARVHAKWPDTAVMLTTQYRMHVCIAQWASEELYEGRLMAAESVAARRLRVGTFDVGGEECTCCDGEVHAKRDELITVYPNYEGDGSDHFLIPPLVLVDTAGCDFAEVREEEGDSTGNPGEVQIAIELAKRLIASGSVTPEELGIIAPYSAQVGLLREARSADDTLKQVEMSTVDGFQGREKDAIIITATRSNKNGDVGFLADKRRMNVAVTRARKHCVLICDTDTVGRHDAFLRRLVAHFEAHGEYVAGGELVAEG
ncbi:AAA domain-containing protein [bacterium]|nr:AAA domain-containing protein [bacterium]